jgi:cleavage stimulation factor subunit 3
MHDLFPEDPQLALFSQRYSAPTFDPTKCRPIISQKSQMKPSIPVMSTIEAPPVAPPQMQDLRHSPVINSPRMAPALAPIVNSPKRPFDEVDNEPAQPRKLPRGESPLKGAAGRRLDAARRNMARASEGVTNMPAAPGPAPLPREITFLLSIIPGARAYQETRFIPERLVALLRGTDLSKAVFPSATASQTPAPTMSQPPPMNSWGAQPPMGTYM